MRRIRKVSKWAAVAVGGLVGLIVVAVVVIWFVVGNRLDETFDIQAEPIPIPESAPSAATGWPLFLVSAGCQECHEDDLGGDIMEENLAFGRIVAPNLTSGRGGIGGTYTDADWVRALRHGVDRDGKPLILMPSHEWNKLSDADLGLIIAYVKNVPAVDNELPSTRVGPFPRVLALIESELISARVIDHDAPRPPEPEPGVTAEYGQYLGFVCQICHGDALSGGTPPGDEGGPKAPDLTPGGNLAQWAEADFIRTLRSGLTPEGNQLDNEFMPWADIGTMKDDELKAIWVFLQSLPAK